VQATVRSYDPITRSGDLLLDDGSVLGFDAEAFDASGLRLLRSGQRMKVRVDAEGAVTFLTLATFRDPAD
jgi:2-phospho-L-lactate guanylyltransferase